MVWVGVENGAEPLTEMARQVEGTLARVGVPREKRGFTAHLTLGRVRSSRNAEALLATLGEARAERFGSATVAHFELMQSQLHPSGSVYTVLDQFRLGAG